LSKKDIVTAIVIMISKYEINNNIITNGNLGNQSYVIHDVFLLDSR